MSRRLVSFFAALMAALSLEVAPAMAAPKDCVPVLDDQSVSIRLTGTGSTGWSGFTVTVNLQSREVSGTLAQERDKKVHTRTLDADELAALTSAFKPLCLKAAVSEGPAPGGYSRFEIQQKDASIRIVGHQGCAPAGSTYYPVTNEVAFGLHEAYPAPDQRRVPPSAEKATATFIEELMFGTPFGPRDTAWSLARLDPKHDRFELLTLPSSGPGARFQLNPKRPDVLRVRELAKALDVDAPVACLVNGEHHIWLLGDAATNKPISRWRLGEVEVRLTLAKGTTATSYSGQTTSADGATVDYVIVQTEK